MIFSKKLRNSVAVYCSSCYKLHRLLRNLMYQSALYFNVVHMWGRFCIYTLLNPFLHQIKGKKLRGLGAIFFDFILESPWSLENKDPTNTFSIEPTFSCAETFHFLYFSNVFTKKEKRPKSLMLKDLKRFSVGLKYSI